MIFMQVLKALDQTLKQHEKYRKEGGVPANEILAQYNCGDLRKTLFDISSENKVSQNNDGSFNHTAREVHV